MWPFSKKDKVKAKYGGEIRSIRTGGRTRISLVTPKGKSEFHFVTKCKVKEGETVTPNATLGWA